ncbi:hypothetical protein T4E_11564 [Trichinella pseudospiralis]|uniref:Uncharacterized protein n=1 Tax=Trichinella pseudospiralis TaxID=6337 RepID=A0A0V0XZC3_TRIPS|nr:hypothetical protein T4E_11564 [Trichinella pseudospiralis]
MEKEKKLVDECSAGGEHHQQLCMLGESECGYLNDGDDERLSFSIFPNLVLWRKNQASFFLNDPFFLHIMSASMLGQSGTTRRLPISCRALQELLAAQHDQNGAFSQLPPDRPEGATTGRTYICLY